MSVLLNACLHTAIVVIFVVCEVWLIVKLIQAVWRRYREDPLPKRAHEASHGVRNEATALRDVLRRLSAQSDPIGSLRELQNGKGPH
jgi:hypothetical protein